MRVEDFLKMMEAGFFKRLEAGGFSRKDLALAKRACCFAANAHFGQKRFSGEDFIFHAIAVADLLLSIRQPVSVIIAGILHDTVEDTRVTLAEIKKHFGAEVAFLVDGMTKTFRPEDMELIGKVFGPQVAFAVKETVGPDPEEFFPSADRDLVYRAKLYAIATRDHRVVFIRLADRLHNLRTLEFLVPSMQKSVTEETREFHLPLAGTFLSLEELKLISSWLEEMKAICTRYLGPVVQLVERGEAEMILSLVKAVTT